MARKTHALIDLNALHANYALAKAHAGASDVIAVIKADAYGHGMVEVAKALQNRTSVFAVAFLDEALTLRQNGIKEPILLLEGPMDRSEIAVARANNCWLMLHTPQHLEWLEPSDIAIPNQIWFKLDTGMHRLGLSETEFLDFWQRQSPEILSDLSAHCILATHFAKADNDQDFTRQQLKSFARVQAITAMRTSYSNSPGLLIEQISADIDLPSESFVRLGISLYGGTPDSLLHPKYTQALTPVMTVKAQVLAIRTIDAGEGVGYGQIWQAPTATAIATVAIGYADGIPRFAANRMHVMCADTALPVVGRISMDMITVDVSAIAEELKVGDMLEVWGAQQRVEQVAQALETINYELLTRLSLRVPRFYINT